MKVRVNKSQYRELTNLQGAPHDVHMLIMCCRPTTMGGTLEGSAQTFEELVAFISEEMAEGMLSLTATRALTSLCVKIDPSCEDWLGM